MDHRTLLQESSSLSSTLLKGLAVLEALARKGEKCGVSELAREVGMVKSNVHRTLQTLVAAGFVRAVDNGMYECTLLLFELGSSVLAKVDVRHMAEPIMQRLADLTQETIHLSVLDKGDVIYLHKIDSPHPVRAYSSIGGRAPAYAVASGKALLAHAGEVALRMLPDPLPRFSAKTVADLGELRRELEQIRVRGYAVNGGEWRSGVSGIASIVFDASGAPVAAIGVSGPTDRIDPNLEKFAELVQSSASSLSEAIGFNPYSRAAGTRKL
jgi:IclR family transcriptional regulator, KDG regulon repressor